jgi:hypothetical protein
MIPTVKSATRISASIVKPSAKCARRHSVVTAKTLYTVKRAAECECSDECENTFCTLDCKERVARWYPESLARSSETS